MLTSKTKIPYKLEGQRYKIDTVENIYNIMVSESFGDVFYDPFLLWTNMGWRDGKIFRYDVTKVIEINLNGNIQYKVGENQFFKILDQEDSPAKFLVIGDFFPFCKKPFRSRYEYEYRKLIDVKEVKYKDKYLYGFQVNSKDHLYMISNGLLIKDNMEV